MKTIPGTEHGHYYVVVSETEKGKVGIRKVSKGVYRIRIQMEEDDMFDELPMEFAKRSGTHASMVVEGGFDDVVGALVVATRWLFEQGRPKAVENEIDVWFGHGSV